MNAKKIKVLDDKKGWIEIGTLSKNELCRGVKTLMDDNKKLNEIINIGVIAFQNLQASIDAMSVEEFKEYKEKRNE